jgi:hypothetical protein
MTMLHREYVLPGAPAKLSIILNCSRFSLPVLLSVAPNPPPPPHPQAVSPPPGQTRVVGGVQTIHMEIESGAV